MKRIILTALIFLSVLNINSQEVSQKETAFKLNVEPVFTYTSGRLDESIYHSTDKSKKISLLEWEKKLFYCGVKADAEYRKVHLITEFKGAVPSETGEMRDSDWMNTADYSMKTTYSKGTNNADKNFDAAVAIKYDFEPVIGIYVSPVAEAQYMYDSFYREKGAEGWYGQADYSSDKKDHWWYEEQAKHYPTEYYWSEKKQKYVRQMLAGIDYSRHTFFMWTGLELCMKLEKFTGRLNAAVSPYTYFSSEDRHHSAGDPVIYHEIQDGAFSYFKIGTEFEYRLTELLAITLQARVLLGKELKGDFYWDWNKVKQQPSGAQIKSGELTAGLRIKIK